MAKKTEKSTLPVRIPYDRDELYDPSIPGYSGESLKMISFPLGGIGTGTIGLGGRGGGNHRPCQRIRVRRQRSL